MVSDLEWLSPTRAWRLAQCPASVAAVGAIGFWDRTEGMNAGALAHRAIQIWIEGAGYRVRDPRASLSEAIRAAESESQGEPGGEWKSARARLLARSNELSGRLRYAQAVHAERELSDALLGIRGRPDIVLIGKGWTTVIDLKTSTMSISAWPPWIVFQLTIYAYLIEKWNGVRPEFGELFSLNRGFRQLPITDESVIGS